MTECDHTDNDVVSDCWFFSHIQTEHSYDVIDNVSGVARTHVPGASLSTAPLRSLSVTDHSTLEKR